MSVIDFAAKRAERRPHMEGTFVCIGCKSEWSAIAPLGTKWLECPDCHLPKGTNKYPFGPLEGDLQLQCSDCGGEALSGYKRKGLMHVICMGCGSDLTDAFYS